MADNPQYVEWSDSLLVGHPEIVEEHKGIFVFAAALRDVDTTTATTGFWRKSPRLTTATSS